jgi:uncharacterized protein YaeQ
MDRNYYQEHALTLARHPSETDERMMVRLLAFAIHANEALTFTKGLFDVEEPDLWQKDLTGAIELDRSRPARREAVILKACGRSEHVVVYSYSATSHIWWKADRQQGRPRKNLTVINISAATSAGSSMAQAHDAAAMHDPGRPDLADRRHGHGRGRARDTEGRTLIYNGSMNETTS